VESAEIDRAVDTKTGYRTKTILCVPLVSPDGARLGAFELLNKRDGPFTEDDQRGLVELASFSAVALENTQQFERLLKRHDQLVEQVAQDTSLVGESPAIQAVRSTIRRVADTELAILILGENGTGKEVVARSLHYGSRRRGEPFVAVNCASLTETLLESELFGHEKGAFTSATQRRIGRFELANGGTIFLDEVTELPLDTQVKLLRVLQESEFERVGSSQTIKVDVRVIAATNRELNEVVNDGTFRADLFYRLNVFPIESPPLRERKGDIPLLVNFFLSRFGKKLGKEVHGVSQKSMQSLVQYGWPGNIRELQNVIERAVVLAKAPIVQVDDSMLRAEDAPGGATAIDTLETVERSHIIRALTQTAWVIHGKKGAAEILGINPSTLRSRMEKLGIRKSPAA
jgi:transcriptional regulator with GAF, ATPase, and Fis domain